MGSGGVLPTQVEVVHQSEHTRVTRLRLPGGTVIRKEPLGPSGERRVRHEVAILERLRGVAGVAQLAAAPQYPDAVVLVDAGSTCLADEAKPFAVDELTGLAVGLGQAVAGMHRRGVMHRDITPANVVLSTDRAPCLVDFALATSFAEIRLEFTHHAQIAGTLAYLAPEATGRTGRPVDQRADLYALGATLYELATGAPPFGSSDLLRLIHDHLARTPAPPAQVNPAVPEPLSDIIAHLLETEPDHRYQTADGLVHDLERVRDALADPEAARLRVGEHDVPARLVQPSRLAGRDDEMAVLAAAFEGALTGQCCGVLVAGAPGVGKTALADQLRSVVTGADGWFVAGKFDQYRRDLEFDAANQAFRALGRLLLAEPDAEVARVRGQVLRAAGPNAGLLAAVLPEFATLLAVSPDPGDPLSAQARAQRAAAAALRAIASPKRPVVMFLDDLQWAGRAPLGFVDLMLSEKPVQGLLLAGAYREDDVAGASPLAAPLSRWLGQATVQRLRLVNLPGPGLVTMVAETLHADPSAAAGLAEVIEPHTRGNPYETLELLNALRRDRLLTPAAAGWRWDNAAVRAHLGRSDVPALLAARAALPEQSLAMMESMACLGGRAEVSVLRVAAGISAGAVDQTLAPAFDEGLLLMEPGAHPAVRFRHDRIREAILGGLDPPRQQALRLAMARRLAAVPELFVAAAEQYLPVAGAVDDAAERRQVVGLLRRAAGQAALIGDYALVNELLTPALGLIDPGEAATLAEVHTAGHAARYGLGRLEEADEEYRVIEELCATALQRAEATAVQVLSLTNRNRFADAIGLGIGALRGLGVVVPPAGQLPADLDRQFGYLYRWLDDTDEAGDLARPEVTDPTLIAVARLLNALLAANYVVDHATLAWLSLEGLRIWLEHGPAPALIGSVSHTAFVAVTLRGDYAAGSRAMRRILAFGEARGYEPGTAQARFLHAVLACWSEPLENGVEAGRRAREGLLAGGDLAYASYTYLPTVYYQLDSAPSLGACLAEAEAGLAFARGTGNEEASGWLDCCRRLTGLLSGEGKATAETDLLSRYGSNPLALFHWHVTAAITAAIFDDPAGLVQHTEAAMPLLPVAVGLYTTAVARVLRCLALADQARAAADDERGRLLAELDEVTRWLAARAADAPDNFLHLLRLVEADRAWAVGDFRAAGLAYDAARREAGQRQRPWHQALIAEHAARFYLARGLDQAGYDLLAQARQQYLAWGATAKASQLDWAYPALQALAEATAGDGGLPQGRAEVTTGTIDLLAIVSASQALSSETSIGRLHARVVEVLSAMTGATGVHLLLWNEDRHGWLLPAAGGEGATVPVSGTGYERAVPVSVLRYVRRTREPLVVADAARDDRFSRDPYFAGVDSCSLLAVPILSRGTLRAVLLLENRVLGGAFTARRLDAVKLIAGQLAVSLDNAQLYAEFRQIAGEQTALRRVAMLVAQAAPPESVFAAVAAEAGELLGVDVAVLVRYDPQDATTVVGAWTGAGAGAAILVGSRQPLGGQNVTTLVFRTGQAARTDYIDVSGVIGDVATRDWGLRSSVGVPIRVEGRLWGAVIVALTREELLPADAEARLAGFTELVATAVASAQARAELQGFGEEQAALRRVATLVARAAPPDEVLATVTEEAGRLLDAAATILCRYDPDGTETVVGVWSATGRVPVPVGNRTGLGGRNVSTLVFQTGRPARIDDYADASGPVGAQARTVSIRASVGVPISVERRLWGVMIVASAGEPLPTAAEARLAGFTELAATAIANAEAQAEVTASRARVVAAADQARRRIERDLHDGAQQRLVSLALLLRAAQASVPRELDAQIDQAVTEAAGALDELREIASGIHPAILAERGLAPVLKTLARRSPVPVDLQVHMSDRLPEPVEVSAYYVITEALTNAAKHSRASTVSVQAEVVGHVLLLEVRDDGAGGAGFSRGTGLAGLRDRVEALGGRIFLDSPRGAGTSLRVELPLTTANGGVLLGRLGYQTALTTTRGRSPSATPS
jgi:signal transduction histidine kinase/predicted ATPase